MTIIQHPTNPAIFVGTPDEFGLAVDGDFSAAGHWIASVDGNEQDLMCLEPEQAMREGERVFELKNHAATQANYEEIDLKEVLTERFEAGRGVIILSANMTDDQILMLVKDACTLSKGKAFQVIPPYVSTPDGRAE